MKKDIEYENVLKIARGAIAISLLSGIAIGVFFGFMLGYTVGGG